MFIVIAEDPCPHNFTRIGGNCYLFGTQTIVNWKTANSICKSYGAHLAELDSLNENNEIIAYLLNHHHLYKGYNNYWLGALNPGLLWIWSSTARPVNPNVNITMIQNQGNKFNATLNKITTGGSSTTTASTTAVPNTTAGNATASVEIEGSGRCLNLVYNATKHMYKFFGLDCMSKRQYLCEIHDKKLSNEISRISRQLFTWNHIPHTYKHHTKRCFFFSFLNQFWKVLFGRIFRMGEGVGRDSAGKVVCILKYSVGRRWIEERKRSQSSIILFIVFICL